MRKILLLHGPNLNALGKRDKEHYGYLSLPEIEMVTAKKAYEFNYGIISYQSNYEGDLITMLQCNASLCDGMIINPGAFTHYSYALYDALVDAHLPSIEVHLSGINQREKWRQHSVISPACIAMISGKKELGYIEAVEMLMVHIQGMRRED